MSVPMQIMAGKRGLILGVANDHSIAWGITRVVHAHGAQVTLTYQGDALERRVRPLAKSVDAALLLPCDVSDEASIDAVFAEVERHWGGLDFLVHAIAFSDKDELRGAYVDTSRQNFQKTLDISCYSLVGLSRRAAPLMRNGGSIITLTYYGAERVVPHYNVMGVAKAALEASVRYLASDLGPKGIRVNALSAGPIRTLAASGVGDFRTMMRWSELNAPLRRNVSIDEVGNTGLYFLSDLSSGVTGEVQHIDSGYHVMGMGQLDSAAEIAELMASVAKKQ